MSICFRCPWSPYLLLLVAAAATASLPAQAGPSLVAYPQDTTTGVWGNTAPLGHSNGAGVEARWQMLIPAAFLPSVAARLDAIEVVATPWSTQNTATYTTLRITLSHLASPLPFPALSPSFAANLPQPLPVYTLANQAITYPLGSWHRFDLQQQFAYNGRDHLVLDFRKVIAAPATGDLFMVTSRDERLDIPVTRVALGTAGSGAANRASAAGTAQPLRVRLLFSAVAPTAVTPTMVVASPMNGGVYFGVGTGIALDTRTASHVPVWQGFDLAGGGLGSRSVPLQLPIVLGNGWVVPGPLLVFQHGIADSGGHMSAMLGVPADPALSGQVVVFQSVVFDPSAGLVWSNAVDATLR
jgi:hypothetical protein